MTSSRRSPRADLMTRIIARYWLRKPELDQFLAIKYPTLASRWRAARNEVAFLRRSPRAPHLVGLNIELTNRCNLACVMCPVNNGMSRRKRDLEFEAFRSIIDGNPGLELLLLFQWGESLLVRDFFRCVAHAVDRGIRVMLTSNGTLLDETVCGRLLDSGIERLTISVDGSRETHESIRGFSWDELRRNVERLVAMRDRRGSMLGIDVNMTIWERNEDQVEAVAAEWRDLVDRVQFIPRFEDAPRRRACRELWRGTLVALSDGRVVPCCRDSEGELEVGRVDQGSLEEIWNGPAMQRLREAHRRSEFPPLCARCGEFETEAVHPRFS